MRKEPGPSTAGFPSLGAWVSGVGKALPGEARPVRACTGQHTQKRPVESSASTHKNVTTKNISRPCQMSPVRWRDKYLTHTYPPS